MSRIVISKWSLLSMVMACAVAQVGCVAEMVDESDPAGALGDEEWSDDGPPPGEEAADADEEELVETSSAALAPAFQLPFPCNQVWAGQTRSNHSPVNSIDFNRADDLGDPVVAAAAGTVTRVANEGSTSYGRWVEIDHGGGYRTRYAHLQTQTVSVGQQVAMGRKIGTVGSTGGSTGPHLHYEVRLNGTAIKPVFNGATALFYGTKNYTSKNSCSSGGSSSITGTVSTSGINLTVRAAASTSSAAVGSLANGTKVTITCQKQGTSVTGTYGTSSLWNYIGTGYVADAYVYTGSNSQILPTCN
ncbi:M23 family metallopeptidase [Chondromyces crocatus]|nr:M23 family metallopeptidase [Chondromyces crocatus]